MSKEQFEQGKRTEDIVHELCQKIFLSDFVIPNPKYKKRSGAEDEIADDLILLNQCLISFQVKSKKEIKKLSEKTDVDLSRIERKIIEGVKQLSSVKRALDTHEKLQVKNKIGIPIDLNTKTVKKIAGVVILDLIGEELLPHSERSQVYDGFCWHEGIPVHIFMRSDFEVIASEIDTPADFLNYLDIREQLYDKKILLSATTERDYLALFKLRPDFYKDALEGNIAGFVIGEGHWEEYVSNLNKLREQRDKLNKSSYLIDEVISTIHTSIGYANAHLEKVVLRSDLKPGTVESYFAIMNELASLTRIERRTVGDLLYRCLALADKRGQSYSLYTMTGKSKGILIFSSDKDRPLRANALQSLTSMAYCRYGLKEIIGIATDNLSASGRSYDFIFFKDVIFDNSHELIAASQTVFSEGKKIETNEFTGVTSLAKKNTSEGE